MKMLMRSKLVDTFILSVLLLAGVSLSFGKPDENDHKRAGLSFADRLVGLEDWIRTQSNFETTSRAVVPAAAASLNKRLGQNQTVQQNKAQAVSSFGESSSSFAESSPSRTSSTASPYQSPFVSPAIKPQSSYDVEYVSSQAPTTPKSQTSYNGFNQSSPDTGSGNFASGQNKAPVIAVNPPTPKPHTSFNDFSQLPSTKGRGRFVSGPYKTPVIEDTAVTPEPRVSYDRHDQSSLKTGSDQDEAPVISVAPVTAKQQAFDQSLSNIGSGKFMSGEYKPPAIAVTSKPAESQSISTYSPNSSLQEPKSQVPLKPSPKPYVTEYYSESASSNESLIFNESGSPNLSYLQRQSQVVYITTTARPQTTSTPTHLAITAKPQSSLRSLQSISQSTPAQSSFSQLGYQSINPADVAGHYQKPVVVQTFQQDKAVVTSFDRSSSSFAGSSLSQPSSIASQSQSHVVSPAVKPQSSFGSNNLYVSSQAPVIPKPQTSFDYFSQSSSDTGSGYFESGQNKAPDISVIPVSFKPQTSFNAFSQSPSTNGGGQLVSGHNITPDNTVDSVTPEPQTSYDTYGQSSSKTVYDQDKAPVISNAPVTPKQEPSYSAFGYPSSNIGNGQFVSGEYKYKAPAIAITSKPAESQSFSNNKLSSSLQEPNPQVPLISVTPKPSLKPSVTEYYSESASLNESSVIIESVNPNLSYLQPQPQAVYTWNTARPQITSTFTANPQSRLSPLHSIGQSNPAQSPFSQFGQQSSNPVFVPHGQYKKPVAVQTVQQDKATAVTSFGGSLVKPQSSYDVYGESVSSQDPATLKPQASYNDFSQSSPDIGSDHFESGQNKAPVISRIPVRFKPQKSSNSFSQSTFPNGDGQFVSGHFITPDTAVTSVTSEPQAGYDAHDKLRDNYSEAASSTESPIIIGSVNPNLSYLQPQSHAVYTWHTTRPQITSTSYPVQSLFSQFGQQYLNPVFVPPGQYQKPEVVETVQQDKTPTVNSFGGSSSSFAESSSNQPSSTIFQYQSPVVSLVVKPQSSHHQYGQSVSSQTPATTKQQTSYNDFSQSSPDIGSGHFESGQNKAPVISPIPVSFKPQTSFNSFSQSTFPNGDGQFVSGYYITPDIAITSVTPEPQTSYDAYDQSSSKADQEKAPVISNATIISNAPLTPKTEQSYSAFGYDSSNIGNDQFVSGEYKAPAIALTSNPAESQSFSTYSQSSSLQEPKSKHSPELVVRDYYSEAASSTASPIIIGSVNPNLSYLQPQSRAVYTWNTARPQITSQLNPLIIPTHLQSNLGPLHSISQSEPAQSSFSRLGQQKPLVVQTVQQDKAPAVPSFGGPTSSFAESSSSRPSSIASQYQGHLVSPVVKPQSSYDVYGESLSSQDPATLKPQTSYNDFSQSSPDIASGHSESGQYKPPVISLIPDYGRIQLVSGQYIIPLIAVTPKPQASYDAYDQCSSKTECDQYKAPVISNVPIISNAPVTPVPEPSYSNFGEPSTNIGNGQFVFEENKAPSIAGITNPAESKSFSSCSQYQQPLVTSEPSQFYGNTAFSYFQPYKPQDPSFKVQPTFQPCDPQYQQSGNTYTNSPVTQEPLVLSPTQKPASFNAFSQPSYQKPAVSQSSYLNPANSSFNSSAQQSGTTSTSSSVTQKPVVLSPTPKPAAFNAFSQPSYQKPAVNSLTQSSYQNPAVNSFNSSCHPSCTTSTSSSVTQKPLVLSPTPKPAENTTFSQNPVVTTSTSPPVTQKPLVLSPTPKPVENNTFSPKPVVTGPTSPPVTQKPLVLPSAPKPVVYNTFTQKPVVPAPRSPPVTQKPLVLPPAPKPVVNNTFTQKPAVPAPKSPPVTQKPLVLPSAPKPVVYNTFTQKPVVPAPTSPPVTQKPLVLPSAPKPVVYNTFTQKPVVPAPTSPPVTQKPLVLPPAPKPVVYNTFTQKPVVPAPKSPPVTQKPLVLSSAPKPVVYNTFTQKPVVPAPTSPPVTQKPLVLPPAPRPVVYNTFTQKPFVPAPTSPQVTQKPPVVFTTPIPVVYNTFSQIPIVYTTTTPPPPVTYYEVVWPRPKKPKKPKKEESSEESSDDYWEYGVKCLANALGLY